MFHEKPLIPLIEVCSLTYRIQYHWKAVWQPLITKYFNSHPRVPQSFCIGKCFVPQDIRSRALYHYVINRLAAGLSAKKSFSDNVQVGGKPSNDFASSGE